jgi:hypothetical protein
MQSAESWPSTLPAPPASSNAGELARGAGFESLLGVRLRPAFESFAGSGPGVGERRFGNGVFESLLGVRLRPEHGRGASARQPSPVEDSLRVSLDLFT